MNSRILDLVQHHCDTPEMASSGENTKFLHFFAKQPTVYQTNTALTARNSGKKITKKYLKYLKTIKFLSIVFVSDSISRKYFASSPDS